MSNRLDLVKVQSGAQLLAQQIKNHILEGMFEVGSQLAPEREMVVQSGLSRATVREAMRILETEGLVETRAGRNGGTWVRRPDRESMSRHLDLFIRGRRIDAASVLEARELLEIASARLAATRRTEEDLAAIEASTLRLEQFQDDAHLMIQENIDWHLAVSKASHNDLIVEFVSSISLSLRDVVYEDEAQGLFSKDLRMQMVKAHRRIFDAIKSGDADAAARRMERHLSESRAVHDAKEPAATSKPRRTPAPRKIVSK